MTPVLGNLLPRLSGNLTLNPDGFVQLPFHTFETQKSEIEATEQLYVIQPCSTVPTQTTGKRFGPVLDQESIRLIPPKLVAIPRCRLCEISVNNEHLIGARHKYNMKVLQLTHGEKDSAGNNKQFCVSLVSAYVNYNFIPFLCDICRWRKMFHVPGCTSTKSRCPHLPPAVQEAQT